jgi:hypothetical protein
MKSGAYDQGPLALLRMNSKKMIREGTTSMLLVKTRKNKLSAKSTLSFFDNAEKHLFKKR